MTLGNQLLLEMLYYMSLAREMEIRIERKLYRQGKIVGGVYVGRGQEAIAAGSAIQLQPEDCICPSHRDMAAFLIRGFTPRAIFAQYLGRKTGPSQGKDTNMHIGDMTKRTVAFVSMLADTVPVAAGIGMAYKMRGQKNVVLCCFGEGATSRGDWHEGLNLAAVQKVPVVFLCNNNQYAYSTPLNKQMAISSVAHRAYAYGIPGMSVDGNDVIEVYDATRSAISRARAGEGPSLIECRTFRMTGHSAHDDASYVPKELFKEWEKKDPIRRLESRLLQEKGTTEDGLKQLAVRISREVDEALALAENDPYPDPAEALDGVYADLTMDAPLAFADTFFTQGGR
ncbi:MAG TPA: thiamine pyrophosphate-dependent dehydrogenase E1 component subunit alpha [Terriglobia bacterium]|nr:thiamine pyrophosphate-dependent dehydrogenase E1 component subunit alpha [Terriglobia bacterium]